MRIVLVASLVAVLAAAGCSSSSGSGSPNSNSVSTACSVNQPGIHNCVGNMNVTPQQKSQLESICTSKLKGQVVSSCPTANTLGCCKLTVSGYNQETCYYPTTADGGTTGAVDGGAAGVYQQGCQQNGGTWSSSP